MFDPTPSPFGDITRHWSHLDDRARDRRIARLVGSVCPRDPVHVDRPILELNAVMYPPASRPRVTIRRHNFDIHRLAHLVELGAVDRGLESFLRLPNRKASSHL